jgi:DNA polymerase (family 10)
MTVHPLGLCRAAEKFRADEQLIAADSAGRLAALGSASDENKLVLSRVGNCMPASDPQSVVKLLREYAQRAALRGGNPYRAKAFARAADALGSLPESLETIVKEGRLQEIPGVGTAIADIITKLYRSGTHPTLEAMRQEIPAGVLALLSIPGIRPEKVLKLYHSLGIDSLASLEEAAGQDRIKSTKGLGASLQNKILQGLALSKEGDRKLHMHRAALLLENAARTLKRARPELQKITIAGDLRRGMELVQDLTLVAQARNLPDRPGRLKSGSELTVHLTDPKHYGATLLTATGAEAHLKSLRLMAVDQGLKLDEKGLWRGRKLLASKEEKDIYAALGLQYIEPELREGKGEIERARKHRLRPLVTDKAIKGILHAHTDLSDGVDTLAQMAEATQQRGYEYFGVADHSQSAHYAGGLSVEEVVSQQREIDALNRNYGKRFRIFKGIEADILKDGSLDYPDDILALFDFVVASVHSLFRLERSEQTKRILRAVANPRTTMLGHMTGRQLLRRPGYEVDIEKILKACAKHGVAVEINANPWRLDLDWRWHGRALDVGCMMSINPDAHSIDEIDLTHWGVEMARKGGVPPDRVLNCMSLREFSAYLKSRGAPKRARGANKSSGRRGSMVSARA